MKCEYRVKAGARFAVSPGVFLREGVIIKLDPAVADRHLAVLQKIEPKRSEKHESDVRGK